MACPFGKKGEILLQNSPIVFLLNVGQLYFNNGFLLRCQVLFNILFESSQHHWLENGL